MKLVFHHFLKSIRSLRWILGLWILIVAIQAVITVLSVQPDYKVASVAEMIGPSALWSLLTGVTWTVVIVYLIQSEPVTGAVSFWLTRPISPVTAVISKSIFILGFVILLGLVPKVTDLLLFGVPLHAVRDAVEGLLFLELTMALCIVWLATYTRNIGQFAGVIGVLFVLFISYSLTLAFTGGYAMSFVEQARPGLIASRWLIATIVFLGGLIVSLILQYFFRATRKAFLVGLGGILLSIAVTLWWPFVLPRLWHGHPSAASPKPISLTYQLDMTKPFIWGSTQLMNTSYQTVKIPLVPPPPTAKGIPFIRSIASTFQPDGGEKTTLPASLEAYSGFTPDHLNWLSQLRQSNPGLVIEGAGTVANEPVPAFMVTTEMAEKLKDQKGTLDLGIAGDIVSLQKQAEIPLGGNGFTRIPQGLVRIIAIQKEKSDLALSVEEAGYRDMAKWQSLPIVYLLVDPKNKIGVVPQKLPVRSQRGNFGTTSKMSEQISLQVQVNDLPQNERSAFQGDGVNELILYVYEVTPLDSFNSDVKDTNYTFHPGDR